MNAQDILLALLTVALVLNAIAFIRFEQSRKRFTRAIAELELMIRKLKP